MPARRKSPASTDKDVSPPDIIDKITDKTAEDQLIDVIIPFTKPISGVVAPMEFKGEEYEFGGLRFTLNKKAIQTYERAFDGLSLVRRIPMDAQEIGVNHPFTIFCANLFPGDDNPTWIARRWADKLRKRAANDAYMIGFTTQNEFSRAPTPYEEDESLNEDNLSSWEKEANVQVLPDVDHDLTDPYERRLKVLADIMSEAGIEFELEFNRRLSNAIVALYRLAGENATDEAGFQPGTASAEVHGTPSTED